MVRGIHKLASSIVKREINLVSDLRVLQLNTSGYCLRFKQRETIINGMVTIFLFFFPFAFYFDQFLSEWYRFDQRYQFISLTRNIGHSR